MDKKQLRKHMIHERESLTGEEVAEKSNRIFNNLCTLEDFKKAEIVLCYASFKNEVDTYSIMQYAWEHNIKLALPRVEGRDMKFYLVKSMKDLTKGYMSILEPFVTVEISAEEVSKAVMIMPGTSFDKKLNRNGYGGGYYDRYLKNKRPACVIGLAYEFQILDSIPAEEHDKKADYIVSEVKIYGK